MKKTILSAISVSLLFCSSLLAQTTLNYTGAMQTYSVPTSGDYSIEVWGAQGGNGGPLAGFGGEGGLGGYSYGEISLTAGQILNVYVGGQGQSEVLSEVTGGFNGGGGTQATSDDNKRPGCGGGATDVRIGGTALTDRVIVAGGGGGAGGWLDADGGTGGGLVGQDGQPPFHVSNGTYVGGGATQLAGGIGGSSAPDGVLGIGGRGLGNSHGGGGGGGGYYGGGGGRIEAGGGGSSYIDGLTNASTTSGLRIGNGQVIITLLCDPTTMTLDQNSIADISTYCSSNPTPPTATTDCGTMNGSPNVSMPVTTPGTTTVTWTFDIGDGNPQTLSHDITITSPTGMSDKFACGPVTIHGNLYSTTQTVVDTLVASSSAGCDSIHTTNLTITNYALGEQNTSDCDSSVVFGNTYYTSQTVYDTIVNGSVNNCDSITAVYLTINNANLDSIDYSTCSSTYFVGGATRSTDGYYTDVYTNQNGCDSTVVTNLSLNTAYTSYLYNEEICQGESILLGGSNQTTSGIYYDTIVSAGCDSLIVTTLNVLPVNNSTMNVTINEGESYTFDGNSLTTSGTYTSTSQNANGCTNTTTLNLTVAGPATIAADQLKDVSVYPNPSTGLLFVERSNNTVLVIEIIELSGKVVYSEETTSDKITLDLNDFNSGVYFVNLKGEDKVSTRRIMLK